MATLKKLMTLLSKRNVSDEQRASLVYSWTNGRTTSARDLNGYELSWICKSLEGYKSKLDASRKRLIASIFGFLEKMNIKNVSTDYVKAVACKASGYNKFNDIPEDRLNSLYNSFKKRQKDLNFTAKMVDSWISDQISRN